MNQMSTNQTPILPQPIRQDLDLALRRLGNATFGGRTLAQHEAPSPALRRDLAARRHDLDRWLTPSGGDEVKPMIAAVLQVMPSQGGKGSVADASKVQKLYVHALSDLPRHAVKVACEAALRGEIGDGHWAPTPGDLRLHAERHCEMLERERRTIIAVLGAPVAETPSNPERKAALLKTAREVASSMRHAAEGERRGGMTPKEIADARVVSETLRTASSERGMPELSPYLRHRLGLPEAPPAGRFADEAAA